MHEGLKSKLLEAVYKTQLLRTEMETMCEKHTPYPAKHSTGERRMREICEEFNVYPVDKKGRKVEDSRLIQKWVWKK